MPAFTSGFLVVFSTFTLDFQALAKVFNIDLQGFSVGVFAIAFVLFVVFQYFWWTDKVVDKLAEGDEVVSYAKQSKWNIRLKLYTIKACHFLFLMVCNNVFQEIWNYYFSPNFDRGRTFLAVVLLLGFVICVPIATFRLISVNKPRGSTEDPDYTFDLEGHNIKFTQEIYEQRMIRMCDIEDKEYNPWVDLFKGYSRTWAEYPVIVMGTHAQHIHTHTQHTLTQIRTHTQHTQNTHTHTHTHTHRNQDPLGHVGHCATGSQNPPSNRQHYYQHHLDMHTFSKVLSIVTLHSKCTSSLTF